MPVFSLELGQACRGTHTCGDRVLPPAVPIAQSPGLEGHNPGAHVKTFVLRLAQHNLFIKTAYKHERQHNLFISHEESASRGLRTGAPRRPRGYTPSNWGGGGQGGLRRGALSRHPRPQCFATRQLPHAGRTHHGPPIRSIHRPPPTASVSLRANCSLSSVLGLGIRD